MGDINCLANHVVMRSACGQEGKETGTLEPGVQGSVLRLTSSLLPLYDLSFKASVYTMIQKDEGEF